MCSLSTVTISRCPLSFAWCFISPSFISHTALCVDDQTYPFPSLTTECPAALGKQTKNGLGLLPFSPSNRTDLLALQSYTDTFFFFKLCSFFIFLVLTLVTGNTPRLHKNSHWNLHKTPDIVSFSFPLELFFSFLSCHTNYKSSASVFFHLFAFTCTYSLFLVF